MKRTQGVKCRLSKKYRKKKNRHVFKKFKHADAHDALYRMEAKASTSAKCAIGKETNNEKDEKALAEAFFSDLRRLQSRCKCTEEMCADITATFGKYIGLKESGCFKAAAKRRDKVMQEKAGVQCLIIHGCVGCDEFVYVPGDRRTHCSNVKSDGTICGHPRLDVNGKPFEVCEITTATIITTLEYDILLNSNRVLFCFSCIDACTIDVGGQLLFISNSNLMHV